MSGSVEDVYPLAPPQTGLLARSLAETEAGLYVVQMRFELSGRLDTGRLEAAWARTVRSHPVLRSAVVWEKVSFPVHVVMDAATVRVEQHDLRAYPATDRPPALRELLRRDRVRGFDLDRAPLMRVLLVQLDDTRWEMVWSHHHVILDGWSAALVMRDFLHEYEGGRGRPEARPAFRDFVKSVAAVAEQSREADLRFWRDAVIPDAGRLRIIDEAAQPRSRWAAGIWSERERPIEPERLARWQEAARQHRVSLPTLYQAAWALTLRQRGLGPDAVAFGVVTSTRAMVPRGTDVVGMCVTSVPQRITLDPSAEVRPWLRRIAGDTAAREEHAAVSPADYREWTDRESTAEPFRYLLAVENYPQEALSSTTEAGDVTCRYLGVSESTNYTLTAGVPAGAPARLKLTYDSRRIAAESVERLLVLWGAAADQLCGEADRTVGDVVRALEAAWEPGQARPETVLTLFAKQVSAGPGRTALTDASRSLTYEDLDKVSDAVAHWLAARGVAEGERVAVSADGSVFPVAAALGVLKAGAAYILLDPRHPAPYRAGVAAASELRFVLSATRRRFPELPGVSVLHLPTLGTGPVVGAGLGHGGDIAPPAGGPGPGGNRLACVSYRSGTAAAPTGVPIRHGGLAAVLTRLHAWFDIGPEDVWALTGPLTMDLSPWQMWAALTGGGRLVVAPEAAGSAEALTALVERERVSVLGIAAGELSLVREAAGRGTRWPGARGVRVAVSQRALAGADLRGWLDDADAAGIELSGVYSPEDLGLAVCHRIGRDDLTAQGRPTFVAPPPTAAALAVLDPAGEDVTPGEFGELYVAVPEWSPTGDRARLDADGRLEVSGRTDGRVTLGGVLIRTSEVRDAVLAASPDVEDCAVLLPDTVEPPVPVAAEPDRLIALITVTRQVADTYPHAQMERRIGRTLRSHLPEATVPAAFHRVDTLSTRQGEHPGGAERRGRSFGGAVEEVRSVWRTVLGVSEVPTDARFFDLGGNSLLMFKVLTTLKTNGWSGVTMTDLFACPTTESLADRLLARRGTPPRTPEPATAVGTDRPGGSAARAALANRRKRGRA